MSAFTTDQGTTVNVAAAANRVSLHVKRGFVGLAETLAPHVALALADALRAAAHQAQNLPAVPR